MNFHLVLHNCVWVTLSNLYICVCICVWVWVCVRPVLYEIECADLIKGREDVKENEGSEE